MPELERPSGLLLSYETAGDPATPPVILLHGFTSDARMWQPQIPALAASYFVVAPDLRGHGRSDAPADPADSTMDDFAQDLLALFDSLEIELGVLVGCSFGGMIAAQFAVNWPQRLAGLVLSDASAAYEHPSYAEAYRRREARMLESEDLVARFGAGELGKRAAARVSDPFLASALRDRYARMSTSGYLGASRVRRERPDLLPLLRDTLTMPVLICTGSDDPVHSASLTMAAEVPGARVVTFRGKGHGLPALAPAAFTDTLLAFLADIESGNTIAGDLAI